MELVGPEGMPRVEKPWGHEVWWAVTPHYLGKRLEVRAGAALSLQYHRRKLETLYLFAGRIRLQVGEETQEIAAGTAVTLPPGTVHRVEALEDAILLEASTPDVDDVVRLEDRYGRAP